VRPAGPVEQAQVGQLHDRRAVPPPAARIWSTPPDVAGANCRVTAASSSLSAVRYRVEQVAQASTTSYPEPRSSRQKSPGRRSTRSTTPLLREHLHRQPVRPACRPRWREGPDKRGRSGPRTRRGRRRCRADAAVGERVQRRASAVGAVARAGPLRRRRVARGHHTGEVLYSVAPASHVRSESSGPVAPQPLRHRVPARAPPSTRRSRRPERSAAPISRPSPSACSYRPARTVPDRLQRRPEGPHPTRVERQFFGQVPRPRFPSASAARRQPHRGVHRPCERADIVEHRCGCGHGSRTPAAPTAPSRRHVPG